MAADLAVFQNAIREMEVVSVDPTTRGEVSGPQWGDFLPFIKVLTNNSKPVTAKLKNCEAGTLVLTADNATYETLGGHEGGDPIYMVPCGSRFKAVDMRDKENTKINFDPQSQAFKEVHEISKRGGLQGVLCGVEFLVWLPEAGKFAMFFFANKTLLSQSEKFDEAKGKIVGVNARAASNDKGSWHGISCEYDLDVEIDMPSEKQIKEAIDQFNRCKAVGY